MEEEKNSDIKGRLKNDDVFRQFFQRLIGPVLFGLEQYSEFDIFLLLK